jgi:hypothetical protein
VSHAFGDEFDGEGDTVTITYDFNRAAGGAEQTL